MPKNFFELSEDEADEIVAERFSLPSEMKGRAKAKPKARRASVRRGSVRRGSRRRTSRPLVAMFEPAAVAADPGRAVADRTAASAREAARSVLSTYIQWLESSDAGQFRNQIVVATNRATSASNVALAMARIVGKRGELDVQHAVLTAANAAAAAAVLGGHCATLARVGSPPDEAERKRLHKIYRHAGEELQLAYMASEVIGAHHGSQDVPHALVSMPAPRVREVRPLSVQEKVDELGGLPMEERIEGLGRPPAMSTDPGVPPREPPVLNTYGEALARAWTKLLRFVPQTVEHLGIAKAVRDDTLKSRWLGSGAYATAFELPDPMYVLKLTADPEDAYISMKLAEANREGRAPLGLIRVYAVFKIELPFRVETRLSGQVRTVYGMVTERALAMSDYKEAVDKTPLIPRAMETLGISRNEAGMSIHRVYEDMQRVFRKVARAVMPLGNYLMAEPRGQISAVEQDFRAGAEWCTERGLDFGADVHTGNFAIVWRDGGFRAVKSDLGHRSVMGGRQHAALEASRLPLAANRRGDD